MRKLLVLTLLVSHLAASSAFAAEPPAAYGKANPGPISAYVMLIRLRWDLYARFKDTGKWPDDKAANEALTAHSQYWDQQLKAGRALLAGGMKGDHWDNVALIIFEATSPEEAEAMVKNDPAVKAYVFQAEVRPFDVNFLTNKFQTPSAASAHPRIRESRATTDLGRAFKTRLVLPKYCRRRAAGMGL